MPHPIIESVVDKDPIFTGHSGKKDLVERFRIDRAAWFIGRFSPLPKALAYLAMIGIVAVIVWSWVF
jgi:hypothetical protein